MKALINFFCLALFSTSIICAQPSLDNTLRELQYLGADTNNTTFYSEAGLLDFNSYEYSVSETSINTKYSEIGSGLFRDKLIMVSSKKIGGLNSGIDPITNLPFTDLFCLDMDYAGDLSRPLLFSRILNTRDNEGQITFSQDEKTMYFTRSSRDNPQNFQLYRTTLQENSIGNWEHITMLDISSRDYSVESPFLKGNELYFASNMPGGFGGFDIYVAKIKEDGTLETPRNLGNTINTEENEKYPFVSNDGKHFYFSSKGHKNLGGYDVFTSRILKDKFKTPRNLGTTVNTQFDEIAFFLTSEYKGYLASNKTEGKGSFDIYKFDKGAVSQILEGIIVEKNTQIPLPNTLVILIDEEGREIGRQFTNEDAEYSFPVIPFDSYTIETSKDGYEDNSFMFEADKGTDYTFNKKLELEPTKASIVEVEDKLMISIENIYFDFDKWTIKQESTISLNKIVEVLNTYPEMRIEINAHTDNVGRKRYNQDLSEKRAASAKRYIISKGIEASRMISYGYGETQPLIDCGKSCTKAQDQTNRRIEFVIIK